MFRLFFLRKRRKPIPITNDYVIKYDEPEEVETPMPEIKTIVIAEEDHSPHAYKAVEWE